MRILFKTVCASVFVLLTALPVAAQSETSAPLLHPAVAARAWDRALPRYVPGEAVAGDLSCAGASPMRELVAAWGEAFQRLHPQATVKGDPKVKVSLEGFAGLIDGQLDCAMFVREPFRSEIQSFADKFGYGPTVIEVAGGSYATSDASQAIAIYVNKDNPLTRLTLPQLDAIFSKTRYWGAPAGIERWGQLGLTGDWAAQPIHVYGMVRRRANGNPPGIENYVVQRVLAGGDFRDDLHEMIDSPKENSLTRIVDQIAADPDGIGYSGFSYAAPGAKILALAETSAGPYYSGSPDEVAKRLYPLSRGVYLVVNRPPGKPLPLLLHEFLSFILSQDGQQIVAEDAEGYFPLTVTRAAQSRAGLD